MRGAGNSFCGPERGKGIENIVLLAAEIASLLERGLQRTWKHVG